MSDVTPDLMRCPSCGAGNPSGARWCGQCHHRFEADDPAGPGTGAPSRPSLRRSGDTLIWTCPACDAANPIDASVCRVCGTSLAAAFGDRKPARRARTSPRNAIALSALLPGMGHVALGATGAAAARAILYLWSLGVSILLLLRPPDAARGIVRLIGALFALSAAAVWLLAMIETMRLSSGDERPVVPRNALTWFSAALSGVLFFGLLGAAMAGRS